MRFSAFRAVVVVVAFAVQSAALSADTPAKNNPGPGVVLPGAAAGDPAASVNTKELKDAITALHNRFEVQGTILAEIKNELGTIRARVDDDLPVKLDPLKASLVELVRRSDDLKGAQGKLADALEKAAADSAAKSADLSAKLAEVQKQTAALDKLHDDIVDLRRDVANLNRPSATAAPAAVASPVPTLVGLAVCTVLLAVFVLYTGRAQRRASTDAVGAAIAQAREQIQASLQQKLQSSSAEIDKTLTGREQSVAETLAQLQQLAERLEKIDRRSDDVPTKSYVHQTVPFDEKTTVPRVAPGEPSIPSQVVWSPPFLDPSSPLARWRALLESHLASKDHPALPVLASLLTLRLLLEKSPAPTLPEVAQAVATLSQAAHAYWQSLADLSDDDRLRASADWIGGIKQLTATAAPKLDIREVVPGTRFDPDTMQTVQEGPGNHLNVATVFSWALLDRSGERPKVLHRARIATT